MPIMDFMLDCTHRHLTSPITIKPQQSHSPDERQKGTYVVCLDCGKEFPYDWKQMHMLPLLDQKSPIGTNTDKDFLN